jgi:hypothetical protein
MSISGRDPRATTLARLRRRMVRLFAIHDLPLEVAGQTWSLAMPADPDAPLDQLAALQLETRGILPGQHGHPESQTDDATDAAAIARRTATSGALLPYWALVWPSGLALAETLLAADILYEQDDLEPLLSLAPRLLAPGGVFWLAEPGRRVSLAFVAEARARGWRDESTAYERIWPTEDKPVRVVVHRYTLPGTSSSGSSSETSSG